MRYHWAWIRTGKIDVRFMAERQDLCKRDYTAWVIHQNTQICGWLVIRFINLKFESKKMANNRAAKFKNLVAQTCSSLDSRIDYKRPTKSYIIVLSQLKNLGKVDLKGNDVR